MAVAKKSGIVVRSADVPLILGMVARGDRRHDIAAWFGLNQGRIAECEDGKHGNPPVAGPAQLPPSGSPGPKARALRAKVNAALAALKKANGPDVATAIQRLEEGIGRYDLNE
jgi:hypothetical protein